MLQLIIRSSLEDALKLPGVVYLLHAVEVLVDLLADLRPQVFFAFRRHLVQRLDVSMPDEVGAASELLPEEGQPLVERAILRVDVQERADFMPGPRDGLEVPDLVEAEQGK